MYDGFIVLMEQLCLQQFLSRSDVRGSSSEHRGRKQPSGFFLSPTITHTTFSHDTCTPSVYSSFFISVPAVFFTIYFSTPHLLALFKNSTLYFSMFFCLVYHSTVLYITSTAKSPSDSFLTWNNKNSIQCLIQRHIIWIWHFKPKTWSPPIKSLRFWNIFSVSVVPAGCGEVSVFLWWLLCGYICPGNRGPPQWQHHDHWVW